MKTKNKIGPNTEPCGTPEVTDTWEDFIFQDDSLQSICKEGFDPVRDMSPNAITVMLNGACDVSLLVLVGLLLLPL